MRDLRIDDAGRLHLLYAGEVRMKEEGIGDAVVENGRSGFVWPL